jgi:dUTP pyrophosphatase
MSIDATKHNPLSASETKLESVSSTSNTSNSEFLIKLLSDQATCPTKAHESDAGYDLYSAVNTFVPMLGKMIVKTDVAVAIPYGSYGKVSSRSGLSAKNSIEVGAGTVDSNYRGEVKVVLYNHSNVDFQIVKGDRIAQLVLIKLDMSKPRLVDELPTSDRGEGGFGSTGK